MEVLLLGTGSADGWPNPFCRCESCRAALSAGELRGNSAALVDDVLLLDCGPDAARAAARAGRSLAEVRTVLLSHSHPDHLAPAALLWRSWARTGHVLEVVGPADALDACRDWLAPDDPVQLVAAAAGDTVVSNGYTCTALEGRHEVPTLLWDVTAPGGERLLYATDTGPLLDGTVSAATGRAYDLVLLEETFGARTDHDTGHLDLTTFPEQVRRLRACGALGPGSRILATHLGHHNPPGATLRSKLAGWGVELPADGDVVVVSGTADRPQTTTAPAHAAAARTLVLGGARSGKSTTAERLLAAEPDVVYLATAPGGGTDPEWAERIRSHRARRPDSWQTVETLDIEAVLLEPGPPVLVDCLALWLTGVLDLVGAWQEDTWRAGGQVAYEQRRAALLAAWAGARRRVVAVSNEVGSGVVPATWSGRLFRDELGRLNAALAGRADVVLLVVAGQVLRLGAA